MNEEHIQEAINRLPNKNFGTGNLTNILYWVYGVGGILAIAFIIYAGVLYSKAQGEPAKVRQAGAMMIYSLIGLGIVALAGAITAFIAQVTGGAQ